MIDAHLHLQDCLSAVKSGPLMDQLRRVGVNHLMVNATSPNDWDAVRQLANDYDEVIPSFGIHPWKVEAAESGWKEQLQGLLEKYPEACLGEVGLDRWIRDHDLPSQRSLFLEQLSIAENFGRPVTIHCLQAWGSLLECLQETDFEGAFLLHSYGGPVEMMQEFVEQGAYFSVSGYFFRPDKAEKLDVFSSVPEERLLLETDAPDMAFPEGQAKHQLDGLKNHPANIEVVYERFAEWSGRPLGRVLEQTEINFSRFLGRVLN